LNESTELEEEDGTLTEEDWSSHVMSPRRPVSSRIVHQNTDPIETPPLSAEMDPSESTSASTKNKSPPWPPEHSDFLKDPLVQEHLILQIAAGDSLEASHTTKSGVCMLVPGSLRHRGDYALVQVSLLPRKGDSSSYQWAVRRMQLEQIHLDK